MTMQPKIELSPGIELYKIVGIDSIADDDDEISVVFADGLEVSICRCRFNPDKFDLHIPNHGNGNGSGGRIEVYLDAEVVVARVSDLAALAVNSLIPLD